jgi:hypothetical protein
MADDRLSRQKPQSIGFDDKDKAPAQSLRIDIRSRLLPGFDDRDA